MKQTAAAGMHSSSRRSLTRSGIIANGGSILSTLAIHVVSTLRWSDMALSHHPLQCRGDANAAGLIFQGWDAAGEGSAAIVYDWERSVLEAVYQAPPRDMGSTQHTQVTSQTRCSPASCLHILAWLKYWRVYTSNVTQKSRHGEPRLTNLML